LLTRVEIMAAVGVLAVTVALVGSMTDADVAAAAHCRNFTVVTSTRTIHVVRIRTIAVGCRGAQRVIKRAFRRGPPPFRFDGWRCRRRPLHRSWRCARGAAVVRFREGLVILRD
jgi:hypothetical protein